MPLIILHFSIQYSTEVVTEDKNDFLYFHILDTDFPFTVCIIYLELYGYV